MNGIQIIERIQARLKAGWCKYHYAKSSMNILVNWDSPNACKFCLSGAAKREAPFPKDNFTTKLDEFFYETTGRFMTVFNDNCETTLDDIINVLEQAKANFNQEF